ncbi:feather keratin cos2-3-like [Limosa lapponica baueri]|uniref:Keratin n=1 Tax=Limosa lapponica baueri TaxID=1758121 RepID=A0A2I0TBX6_LIMLA|nr:feather keratin cos2-3-like [Limosa lapponica baueri]
MNRLGDACKVEKENGSKDSCSSPILVLCFLPAPLPGAPPPLRHVLLQPVPALPALRPNPTGQQLQRACVRQCQNSTIVIEPPAVVVTLPGAILSSFPQNTVVGSSTSAAVGSILSCDGVPITSGCCDLSGISSRYYGRRSLL